MKNIVLAVLFTYGSIAGQEASAQGLRGCLGGAIDQAGCNYTEWMETKYNLSKAQFMQNLDGFYEENAHWYARSIGKDKKDFMLEIAQAIVETLEKN